MNNEQTTHLKKKFEAELENLGVQHEVSTEGWKNIMQALETLIEDQNLILPCPECDNPYPHHYRDGSWNCKDCGHKWNY